MRFNVEDETFLERSGQPVVNHDDSSHEQTMFERGEFGFQNSRVTTFCCEACAEYQRSRIDSENWESFRSTRSSARFTTKPGLQSVQSRVKENYSGSGQHRMVWIARDGSHNAVHNMLIILERRHRLLHMRVFLAERNIGQSTFRWIHDGFFISRACLATEMRKSQETKNIWPINWRKNAKQKKFQRVHDRFLRDHDFLVRMIEHNRDEKFCRAWNVLADEDHIHLLTVEEYFHYENKWWLHSKRF